MKGERFEGEPHLVDLLVADTSAVEEWDIRPTDGRVELGAGRRLDDIHDKKKIMVFSGQRVRGVGVRPYYTVKDKLSLECRTGAMT